MMVGTRSDRTHDLPHSNPGGRIVDASYKHDTDTASHLIIHKYGLQTLHGVRAEVIHFHFTQRANRTNGNPQLKYISSSESTTINFTNTVKCKNLIPDLKHHPRNRCLQSSSWCGLSNHTPSNPNTHPRYTVNWRIRLRRFTHLGPSLGRGLSRSGVRKSIVFQLIAAPNLSSESCGPGRLIR